MAVQQLVKPREPDVLVIPDSEFHGRDLWDLPEFQVTKADTSAQKKKIKRGKKRDNRPIEVLLDGIADGPAGFAVHLRDWARHLDNYGVKVRIPDHRDCEYPEVAKLKKTKVENPIEILNYPGCSFHPLNESAPAVIGYSVFETNKFPKVFKENSEDVDIIWTSCVPPGEMIQTPHGFVPIEDINKGSLVLTHRGHFREVTKVFCHQHQGEVVKIDRYGAPSLTLTPIHRLYASQKPHRVVLASSTFDFDWIEAKDLTRSSYIAMPRFTEVTDVYIDIGKYLPEYTVVDGELSKEITAKIHHRNRYMDSKSKKETITTRIKKMNVPAKVKLNKELARIIGYFLAEGYAEYGQINFTFGRHEEEYKNEVITLMKGVFGLKCSLREKTTGKADDLRFFNTALALLFRRLFYDGFGKKVLPEALLYASPDILWELLDAMINGDGCKTKKGCAYTTTSPNLAGQFMVIASKVGFFPSMSVSNAQRRWNKSLNKCISHSKTWSFSIEGSNGMRMGFSKANTNNDRSFQRYKAEEDKFINRIKGIAKERYTGPVYNLEVEEDNSYVCTNTIVHNSQFCFDRFVEIGIDKKKVDIFPEGVDTTKFRPDLEPLIPRTSAMRFVNVCGYSERKGMRTLISAFLNEFDKKEDDVELWIFGGWYSKGKAEDEVAELKQGIKNKTAFPKVMLDWTDRPDGDMPRLFNSFDAGVYPTKGEGYGRPLAECAACGVPVITTGYAPMNEIITKDTGYLIDVDHIGPEPRADWICDFYKGADFVHPSEDSLRALMREVFDDYEKAEEKAERGREYVLQHHNTATIIEKVVKRLKEIRDTPFR